MKNKVHSTKLKHYEKATKFEKNLPPVLTKQLFLLSSVKTSGGFFSNFCGLLKKLDFSMKLQYEFAMQLCRSNKSTYPPT